MFEDICLMCGKGLQDDGRAYCSDECQSTDLVSPSISSSSSSLSSPSLGFAQGAEIPTLAPSALGSALRKFEGRDSYFTSSSGSSNSWGLVEDDDDEDPVYGSAKGYSFRDGMDSIYEGSSKSANFIYSMMPPSLSYTRRPSDINHHSIIPQVHQRSSSGDSPVPKPNRSRGALEIVPNPPHSSSTINDEDEDSSDSSLYSRDMDNSDSVESSVKPLSTRRKRNRASLPEYFTLLQVKSPSKEALKPSPAVARPSPPTPTSLFSSRIQDVPLVSDSPRGCRRDAAESRSSRRSEQSTPSRSRSRNIRRDCIVSPRPTRILRSDSVEQAFDSRGRTNIRRKSSPPPRMLMGVEDPARAIATLRDLERAERSQSNSRAKSRGRVPVQELEGVGSPTLAPGFGNGRSGLVDRGRIAALAKRVPL